jgi:hypothetical protein
LGHNILHKTIGFVWLYFADGGAAEEATESRKGQGGHGYQSAALVCFVVFADNVLKGDWRDKRRLCFLGEFGPTGTARGLWDAQCAPPTPVLV